MFLKFGKEILILGGRPKWGFFYLFWEVQMFGQLLFDSMLFFGPSFSHLICYFGYFFVNSMALFKIEKGEFGTFNLG